MHISDVHVYTAVNFIVPRTNKTVSCYAVVIEPQPTVDNKEQVDFKDGVAYIELKGACSGCPSLACGVMVSLEQKLRAAEPEVLKVNSLLPKVS